MFHQMPINPVGTSSLDVPKLVQHVTAETDVFLLWFHRLPLMSNKLISMLLSFTPVLEMFGILQAMGVEDLNPGAVF
jgi:hypothetical protein